MPCLYHGVIVNRLEEWKLNPGRFTEHLTKELVKAGTQSLLGKTLSGMTNSLKRGDPILNINPYSNSEIDIYLCGINGWKGANKKTLSFGSSGGLTYNTGVFYGWTPEKYEIKHPQMFGAIKYHGVWRGVRFVE